MSTPILRSNDIGAPRLTGRTKQTDSSVEIVSGGADIWGTRDECHFANLAVQGDFELSVQVNAIGMADLYSKAGIMWRASLDAEAAHVMLLAFGNNDPRNKNNGGIEFQSRLSKGVECSAIYPPQPLPSQPDFPVHFPKVWLKLIRKGDTFTGLFSRDGLQWKPYCEHRQAVPASGYLGLAATSHNEAQTITSRFSNLRVS